MGRLSGKQEIMTVIDNRDTLAIDSASLSEAGARDYFELLKPRVMSLVVFTAFAGLILAPGQINPILGVIAILCIAVGDHDENIDFDAMVMTVGAELAERVRDATLRIYRFAADFAAERGILLADTKFEFGTDADGRLYIMDEMLTPDSSRYWPADQYELGTSPPSYDKQFVRDYLETLDWGKTAPGPSLPAEVIERTRAKYAEALQRLAGISVD